MTGWITRPGLGRGDTEASLPTFVHVIQHHATHFGSDLAISFLVDGETKEDHLTFTGLDARARQIAVTLQAHCAPGDRALLLFPPGLDYVASFFGCLYAGVIAVPAYPPDPSPARLMRTLPRLQTILADAGANIILTNKGIKMMAPALYPHAPEFAELTWCAVDDLEEGLEVEWTMPDITGNTLAFLQYTSGSTGTPKGVMLSHENLLQDIETIQAKYEHTPHSVAAHWVPPYHDMGLIGGILTPLHGGFPGYLMSPMSFLRRPIRWLNLLTRLKGDISSGGPNFAFELCIRKTTPEQRAEMDLSNWTVCYSGAEPIRAKTLLDFAETFATAGFEKTFLYPCYGLAEATLLVAGAEKTKPPVIARVDADALERGEFIRAADPETPSRTLVSVGQGDPNHTLVVVDPETATPCREGRVGELWVQAPIVAQGYWKKAEATESTFGATLEGHSGTFLRTGDLAYIEGLEVFVTGRIKDMIIIRGANHYPQDFEVTIEESHPHARKGCVAAFALQHDDEEKLGIVTEVDTRDAGFDAEAVLDAITREVVAKHQVTPHVIALIKAKTIFKTSSGKIQRYASKTALLNGELELVAKRG